jgi:hypothetical protein
MEGEDQGRDAAYRDDAAQSLIDRRRERDARDGYRRGPREPTADSV